MELPHPIHGETAMNPSDSAQGGSSLESFYHEMINSLPQAVFFKDRDSRMLAVNEALAKELKLKPAEIVGKTDFDFFPKGIAEKYRVDDLRVMTQKKSEVIEEVFTMGNTSRIVEVMKSPVLNDRGEAIGLIGIFNDVTKQKSIMDNLRKSESEFRSVWESSLDGMRLTDEDGNMLLVNEAFCRMVGKSMEELVSQPFTVIYDEVRRQESLEKHKKRFAERDIAPLFERELLLWNGEKIWFELSNNFLEIEGQKPHLLSILRDISERKIAEEKMREFSERLERSNRELQDFAYVASHDLQEPLRKVSVFGDRLKTKFSEALGVEGVDYLERMQKATVRMQALINDLLIFSRVTSKAQPFVPVDLEKIAQEVIGDLEMQMEQTGGKVAVSKLPTIDAEPLHMRQLFQNLIGNALKFHPPDRKPLVTIKAEIIKKRLVVRVKGVSTRQWVQITVSDNGIGFEEKYLDRIFQVFQRLHARSSFEGTGMGLAITRKIVEYHHGTITAKSTPGQGSTFIVTLPVKQEQPEQPI